MKFLRSIMKAISGLFTEGWIKVTLRYTDREVVHYNRKNLIVLGGKLRILKALYLGGNSSKITSLRVGNGGTVDPEGRFPKPVNKDLTSLFSQVQSVPVSYTVDETFPFVTFLADIDPEQCNNLLVSEAGLFFEDGGMFNIKTFPGIPKTQDFSIHFEWTIRIK